MGNTKNIKKQYQITFLNIKRIRKKAHLWSGKLEMTDINIDLDTPSGRNACAKTIYVNGT